MELEFGWASNWNWNWASNSNWNWARIGIGIGIELELELGSNSNCNSGRPTMSASNNWNSGRPANELEVQCPDHCATAVCFLAPKNVTFTFHCFCAFQSEILIVFLNSLFDPSDLSFPDPWGVVGKSFDFGGGRSNRERVSPLYLGDNPFDLLSDRSSLPKRGVVCNPFDLGLGGATERGLRHLESS